MITIIENVKQLLIVAQINSSDLDIPKADFGLTAASVMSQVAQIAVLLSVIFVAVGGLKYTTSAGDPQSNAKAKNTILYAVIGLVVSLSASVILAFVTGRIG